MKITVAGETVQVRGRTMEEIATDRGGAGAPGSAHGAEPHYEIHPLSEDRFALSLWGRFPPAWCGSLSLSLSQVGLGVVQGFAKKVREKAWVAEFEIESARGGLAVDSMDFIAMAVSSARAPGLRRLALSAFTVGDPAMHGGAIYLEIRGRDQVGFLAELLGQLAFLTFFPEEMVVQTIDDAVFDRFLLRGPAGQTPAPGACQALSTWLEGLRAA